MDVAHQSGDEAGSVCVGVLATDPLRCIGLQAILEDSLQMSTAILTDGALPKGCKPRVIILDAGLDVDFDLRGSVRRLRAALPGAKVVVLARAGLPSASEMAVDAGAVGFLQATAEIEEIHACLEAILAGSTWLPVLDLPPAAPPTATSGPADLSKRFTPKEREVLSWLTHGRSNREIASTMSIDEATVKAHLGRMLRKAKVSNRVELTLRALGEPL